jgi:hypothetical protein
VSEKDSLFVSVSLFERKEILFRFCCPNEEESSVAGNRGERREDVLSFSRLPPVLSVWVLLVVSFGNNLIHSFLVNGLCTSSHRSPRSESHFASSINEKEEEL